MKRPHTTFERPISSCPQGLEQAHLQKLSSSYTPTALVLRSLYNKLLIQPSYKLRNAPRLWNPDCLKTFKTLRQQMFLFGKVSIRVKSE